MLYSSEQYQNHQRAVVFGLELSLTAMWIILNLLLIGLVKCLPIYGRHYSYAYDYSEDFREITVTLSSSINMTKINKKQKMFLKMSK